MVISHAPKSLPCQVKDGMERSARKKVSEVRSSATPPTQPVVEETVDRRLVVVVEQAEGVGVTGLGQVDEGDEALALRLVLQRGDLEVVPSRVHRARAAVTPPRPGTDRRPPGSGEARWDWTRASEARTRRASRTQRAAGTASGGGEAGGERGTVEGGQQHLGHGAPERVQPRLVPLSRRCMRLPPRWIPGTSLPHPVRSDRHASPTHPSRDETAVHPTPGMVPCRGLRNARRWVSGAAPQREPAADGAGDGAGQAGREETGLRRLPPGAVVADAPALGPGVLAQPRVGVDHARVADQAQHRDVVGGVGVGRAAGEVQPLLLGDPAYGDRLVGPVQHLPDQPAGVDAVDVLGDGAQGPGETQPARDRVAISTGAAVTSQTRCPWSRCICASARVPGQIRSAIDSSKISSPIASSSSTRWPAMKARAELRASATCSGSSTPTTRK